MSSAIHCIYYGGPMDHEMCTVQAEETGGAPLEIRVVAPRPINYWEPCDLLEPTHREGRYVLVEVRRKQPGQSLLPEIAVGEILGVTYHWRGWIGDPS